MKSFLPAILAILFSFCFSSAAAEEEGRWVDTPTAYNDWGCVMRLQTYTKGMRSRWDRRCPQNFDDFYKRLNAAQKKVALKEGLKILRGLMDDHPERDEMALVQFFLREIKKTT